MSRALQPYLNCIRATCKAALCIYDFPSQLVERHNKPEVEVRADPELVLQPVTICYSETARFQIEPSINSVRFSILFNKTDEIEVIIAARYMKFLTQRAEKFMILRRQPMDGFDISFLITNREVEAMFRDKIVNFLIEFLSDINKDIMDMKIEQNARARVCVHHYLNWLSVSGIS